MNEGVLRLFLALPLSEEARAAAAAAAAPLRARAPRLRWVEPALYHLTLRFLGDTEPARLPAIVAAFGPAVGASAPFALRLGALDTLPRGRNARVLALALAEGGAPLARLAAALEDESRRLGYAPETRPFRPHLTLARSRQGETLPPGLALPGAALAAAAAPAWRAETALLMESELSPRGPRYRIRASFPLGGREAAGPTGGAAAPD
ncbi:RNA 2',3'-cyclic phosphodiesterase [bacterium]|nr:RNA 2',3'-cyclic phosphodiesterase [bacterium]